MSATTAKDVIRVATRVYTNGSVKGVRTYLHINCDCRIASSLMGTYDTLADANRKAGELLKGTGDHARTCTKSGPVKATATVHRFHDTRTAYRAAFSGLGVRDGDLVVVEPEGVIAVVIGTAVCALTVVRGELLSLDTPARQYRGGQYAAAADKAAAIAPQVGAVIAGIHDAAPAPADDEPQDTPEPAAPAASQTPADIVRTDGVTIVDAEAPTSLPGPEWGTLKGITAPFRLWGEEREGGRFAPAFDRKHVTGKPLEIVEVWTTQRGTARHGRDANGREIHLYGAATRFWRAPGA